MFGNDSCVLDENVQAGNILSVLNYYYLLLMLTDVNKYFLYIRLYLAD